MLLVFFNRIPHYSSFLDGPCDGLWVGMPKTPTLKDIAAAGLIKNDVELVCVVRGAKTFLDNLNGLDLSSSEYRRFSATLKRDGKIHFDGQAYPYPATAGRAVRRIVEQRSDSIPEKTGGWLYWHFKDEHSRKWCQIEDLRRQAESQKRD